MSVDIAGEATAPEADKQTLDFLVVQKESQSSNHDGMMSTCQVGRVDHLLLFQRYDSGFGLDQLGVVQEDQAAVDLTIDCHVLDDILAGGFALAPAPLMSEADIDLTTERQKRNSLSRRQIVRRQLHDVARQLVLDLIKTSVRVLSVQVNHDKAIHAGRGRQLKSSFASGEQPLSLAALRDDEDGKLERARLVSVDEVEGVSWKLGS